jgi:SAM-dependent methyltransferase
VSNPVSRRLRKVTFRVRYMVTPRPRLVPLSREFGFDRGTPIDRFYIEDFIARHGVMPGYSGGDIVGRVLEVGGGEYTSRYAGDGLERADVLHVSADNPDATVIGDLATGAGVPDGAYDCVICTQTLNVIYDVHGAVGSLHRSLAPGGVLLLTVAGICQAARPDRDEWGDFWRFTSMSVRRLLEERFDPADVRVEAYGNLAAATSFLEGRAAAELRQDELVPRDPDYEILIAARAQKRA